jgi:hypothetical protein
MNWSARGNVLNQYLRNTSIGTTVKAAFTNGQYSECLIYSFAVLEIHAFERLLGPCMDIMKRNISNYEETLNNLGVEHTDLR